MVEGDADGISDRGAQITNLAAAMSEAATLLTKLVDHGADMEGEAVDKLREVSAEVNTELEKAAGLYDGVGPFIKAYGDELSAVQKLMSTSVPDADRYWLAYQRALDQWQDAANSPVRYPMGSEDDIEACTAAERRHADDVETAECDKNDAYLLWKGAADDFDGAYDRWEDAFDAAVAGVRDSTAGKIKDSWKDNLDGFVDFALDVLAVAGLVLAVLALIVGGPIVGLLALAVGVLALVGTTWQYSRGDAALWEVGVAVVGVLPFGSFTKFADGGFGAGMRAWTGFGSQGMSLGDDAARWTLSLSSANPAEWVSNMRMLTPEAGYVTGARDLLNTVVRNGNDAEMWSVVRQIGTPLEQLTYVTDVAGNLVTTADTVIGGVSGAYSLAERAATRAWPW
ncbi:hypothetical protein [Microbacterium sp. C7(2022)]|uniref:hypothetical protein n=1 Tax=Microbacterium sp. C7(2022) TaxID=2992759 RepID=UPI00237BE095|nr:hypothetical protein [Microbacterium sp. C7(2022)]MDE0547479.1 hypothetical protein [Microbacterium sp. C7(2022)]